MKTKIIIADDHKIIREGLRSLIGKEKDLEVVAEASDGREAIQLARRLKPDLIIMDVNMPSLNGIEATRQILSILPETQVIALSMHSDRRFVSEMFKAGASGYLIKDCAFEELVQGIRKINSGMKYVSPSITSVLLSDYMDKETKQKESTGKSLSGREREVLQLIAEGFSTKEVASKLNLSVKTIETHKRQIMNKLEIYTVAELTKFAIREGLTSLES